MKKSSILVVIFVLVSSMQYGQLKEQGVYKNDKIAWNSQEILPGWQPYSAIKSIF